MTSDGSLRPLCGVAFERARFPMAFLDADLRVVRANRCLAQLLGLGAGGLVGRCLDELVHDDDVALLRSAVLAATGGPTAPFELRIRASSGTGSSVGDPGTASGAETRVEVVVETVDDVSDVPVRYLAQMRDVTDERLAAERLRRLVRLHATLSGADEAVLRASKAEELLASACQIAVDHGGFLLAWIGQVGGQDESLELVAAKGPGRAYLEGLHLSAGLGPEGQGPAGTAVRQRRPQVRDIVSDPRMAPWRSSALAAGFASCASFPLVLDGRAAGVLTVYAGERDYFDDEVLALLERLVENVSYGWQALEHDAARRRSQAELEEQTRRLRQRFEQTSVPSLTLDLAGRIHDVNEAMCALAGQPAAALAGSLAMELFVDDDSLVGLVGGEGTGHAFVPAEVVKLCLRRPDGGSCWVLVSGTLVRDASGECFEVYVQMQDVSRRHVAEQLAARRQSQQAALAELGREALAEEDLGLLFERAVALVAAHATVELVELLEEDEAAGCFHRRAATGFRPDLLAATNGTVPFRGSLAAWVLRSGAPVVVTDLGVLEGVRRPPLLVAHGVRSSAGVVVGSGDLRFGILAVHSSIPRGFDEDEIPFLESVAHVIGAAVARRRAADELVRRAQYDRLTGLPSRALLIQSLEEMLAPGAGLTEVALLFVDLDRFKLVNDSLGHGAGDDLLRACGERVAGCVADRGLVARFGGDELVVVAAGLGGADGAVELSGGILAALARPVDVAGQELSMGASIGIALGAPGDGPSDLLRNADIAMYRAKGLGGSCAVVFDAAMRASLEDRLQLEAELRRALERDELVVHYQPVVDLPTGLLVGAEALVRWSHPTRGMIEPASFVPLAEETGLIVGLGERVLSLVCADLARWSAEVTMRHFVVAVNVSARQLRSPAYPASVAATLALHGVPASGLSLEITESVLLEDSGTTLAVLQELKDLGVRLSVDDFGTGYSSLSYLQRYPIDELKVDRSFVAQLSGNETQAAIVTGVVQLARALEVAVVAEGVETSDQLGRLRALGCDRAQGFLISTPVGGEDFEERWLHLSRV